MTFSNFASAVTSCGAKQAAIRTNKYEADYYPIQHMNQIEFKDCLMDASIYLDDPNPAWANTDDCIGFPCTAPQNILLDFSDTLYTGSTPKGQIDFQVISDTQDVSNSF